MASTRLPGKPLADIAGLPMIVQVLRRAEAAKLGPVVVACDDETIATAVEKAGGRALMTRADHPSGSDRIFEALGIADPDGRAGIVINVQGDLPTLEPEDISAAARAARRSCGRHRNAGGGNQEAGRARQSQRGQGRGLAPFARAIARALLSPARPRPSGDGPLYHHIGLYAYRRAALERFVKLPPSPLEQRERLEQLRALEAGMRIDVAIVDTVPLGVDTPEDLETARGMLR